MTAAEGAETGGPGSGETTGERLKRPDASEHGDEPDGFHLENSCIGTKRLEDGRGPGGPTKIRIDRLDPGKIRQEA